MIVWNGLLPYSQMTYKRFRYEGCMLWLHLKAVRYQRLHIGCED